ncbi:hypothetical protein QTP88_013119 [Uroleucon formosanum]
MKNISNYIIGSLCSCEKSHALTFFIFTTYYRKYVDTLITMISYKLYNMVSIMIHSDIWLYDNMMMIIRGSLNCGFSIDRRLQNIKQWIYTQ